MRRLQRLPLIHGPGPALGLPIGLQQLAPEVVVLRILHELPIFQYTH